MRNMREPERFIATILLFLLKHSRLGFVRGFSGKGNTDCDVLKRGFSSLH